MLRFNGGSSRYGEASTGPRMIRSRLSCVSVRPLTSIAYWRRPDEVRLTYGAFNVFSSPPSYHQHYLLAIILWDHDILSYPYQAEHVPPCWRYQPAQSTGLLMEYNVDSGPPLGISQ